MNIYKLFSKPSQLSGYNKRNIIVPQLAYEYARQQEKRVPEAEPYIKQNPEWAFLYALNVIKGRFLDAEPYIMKDSYYAYYYATEVIKGRWPEAEPFIRTDISLWRYYNAYLYSVPIY